MSSKSALKTSRPDPALRATYMMKRSNYFRPSARAASSSLADRGGAIVKMDRITTPSRGEKRPIPPDRGKLPESGLTAKRVPAGTKAKGFRERP